MVGPALLFYMVQMSTALAILNKLRSIDVLLSAQIAIEETAAAGTAAQKKQLFQGVTKLNSPINPFYTARTVAIKAKKGQPTDRVTLKDTGDFYAGILIDVRGDLFVIESADWKNSMLQDRYGENILGLGTDARIEYIQTLRPVFIEKIKSYLTT